MADYRRCYVPGGSYFFTAGRWRFFQALGHRQKTFYPTLALLGGTEQSLSAPRTERL